MSRPIWKGQISFGLVNVPVVLHSAERRADIHFHLVDSRNAARIRYERVNEETGEEVPWDKIVKGFEYADGNYVLLSEEELERASVEMTRTIEIEQFVDLAEIDLLYFDRPYYLVPGKGGEKGYVLMREALAGSGKAGIARVVIRARQYLAALLAEEEALVLELLRYTQELRSPEEYEFPERDLRKHNVNKKEVALAEKLIEGMTAPWDPSQYQDEYRDVLMKLIEKKIESGHTEVIETNGEAEEEVLPKTINFMDVLKKSVATASKKRTKRKPARKKKAPPHKRPTRKKKAG